MVLVEPAVKKKKTKTLQRVCWTNRMRPRSQWRCYPKHHCRRYCTYILLNIVCNCEQLNDKHRFFYCGTLTSQFNYSSTIFFFFQSLYLIPFYSWLIFFFFFSDFYYHVSLWIVISLAEFFAGR